MSSSGNRTTTDPLSSLIESHQTSITQKRLEIKELKERIASFYREQNSHLPIFTLPDELLVLVFRHYITLSEIEPVEVKTIWDNDNDGNNADADDPNVDDEDGGDSADDYDEPITSTRRRRRRDQRRWWLVPSHVCSRWRSVSLGNASLWTVVNTDICSRLRWISLLLSRSGEASLDVTMRNDEWGDSKQKITKLLKRARRIRSLELRISLEMLEEAIDEGCISGTFDTLESLDIQVRPPCNDDWTSSLGKGSALPALLQKVTPLFTHLTLVDIYLDLETLLSFPLSLTDLSISYESRHPRYLVKDLVAGLARLASLERLHLECTLSDDTPSSEVRLPNLRELFLADDKPTVIDFFQSLSLPATTRINLTVSLRPGSGIWVILNSVSIISRRIHCYIDLGERKLTRAALIQLSEHQCVQFKLGYDECGRHDYIFELSIHPYLAPTLWDTYMFPLLQEEKALSQIKTFSVQGGLASWLSSPPDWLKILAENVETIMVDDQPFVLHTS